MSAMFRSYKPALIAFCLLSIIDCRKNTATIPQKQSDNRYRVIADKGAIARAKPDTTGAVVANLPHGSEVKVIEFLPDLKIVRIGDHGYEGRWARLDLPGKVAYLFGALLEPAHLDEYVCEMPAKPRDIHIKTMGALINLCPDGTYVDSEFYTCGGVCTGHGCWREVNGKIQLSARKSFYFEGVGEPTTVTHAAYYENYRPVSKANKDSAFTDLYKGFDGFEKFQKTGENNDNEFREVGARKAGSSCRRSYLFGNY